MPRYDATEHGSSGAQMARYYTNLFSPETFEAFSRSDQTISGFRHRQRNAASKIKPGDRLLCYMTGLSRWVGVFEVLTKSFQDTTPVFYPEDDPFTVRFKVRPLVWLTKEQGIPIHDPRLWSNLSFTRNFKAGDKGWTGKLRNSLNRLEENDGALLERELLRQDTERQTFEVNEDKYQKLVKQRVRAANRSVTVTVPENETEEAPTDLDIRTEPASDDAPRESFQIQALLAEVGEKMGFRIWLPRSDRGRVLELWKPASGKPLEVLPLNYDDTTLRTIEQIDVLWLKGRAIARAFEVEHTTSIYSGLLRMADLLALQPNMDINLHIVAPESRREKVLNEIQRPVFSLLDRGPLSESCTFISYESMRELASQGFLSYMSDSVLEQYAESAD
jgi:predicted RNA-binding protein